MIFTALALVETSSVSVRWTDTSFREKANLKLTVTRTNTDKDARLRLAFESEGQEPFSSIEDGWNQPYSDWRLAIPIAVKGSRGPHILAKLYRPNWLDFVLYTVDPASAQPVKRSFGFSCREETAIRWNVFHGKLVSFQTFDRFGVPLYLRDHEKRGYRWQKKTTYRFDAAQQTWKPSKGTWEAFRFGTSPPGQIIESANDCAFRFKE